MTKQNITNKTYYTMSTELNKPTWICSYLFQYLWPMDLCDVKEVTWRIVDLVKAVYAWVRSAFGSVHLEKAKMLSKLWDGQYVIEILHQCTTLVVDLSSWIFANGQSRVQRKVDGCTAVRWGGRVAGWHCTALLEGGLHCTVLQWSVMNCTCTRLNCIEGSWAGEEMEISEGRLWSHPTG